MIRRAFLLVLAACESTSSPQPPEKAAPPAVAPLPPDAAPPGPRMPVVKTWAYDDLPHRTAELAPVIEHANDCIPSAAKDRNGEPIELSVAIDAFDGKLVACLQSLTRQGGSVFFDRVSHVCWNVDPASGKLTRRSDLSRAFFACQDGCDGNEDVSYHAGTISYDGHRVAVWPEEPEGPITIYELPAKKQVTSFKQDALDFTALYLGNVLIEGAAYDETGTEIAKLPAGEARVLDDTRAIIVDGKQATIFNVSTKRAQAVTLDRAYTAGPVAFAGGAFAIAGRKLFVLDQKLKLKKTINLPACRARSD